MNSQNEILTRRIEFTSIELSGSIVNELVCKHVRIVQHR
jgi:hypothetical protein